MAQEREQLLAEQRRDFAMFGAEQARLVAAQRREREHLTLEQRRDFGQLGVAPRRYRKF